MHIDKVTITGADDLTDPLWMLDVQRKYPFVEWGILVSARHVCEQGAPRFPSKSWLVKLQPHQPFLQTSIHVCGRWVRQICKGQWDELLDEIPTTVLQAQRIQLNFHAEVHKLSDAFFENLRGFRWPLIFQLDGVNDDLLSKARLAGIDASPLYDLSGGAGVLPKQWLPQTKDVYTGYAGGLGPHNVLQQVEQIRLVANGRIWIDMETHVRTPDNKRLDEMLVERVLSLCDSWSGLIR